MTAFHVTEPLGPNIGRTSEGFLVCRNVPLARTGAQLYSDQEVPIKSVAADGRVIVMRDADEVFRPETIASLQGKPVTIDHPDEDVGPHNYHDVAVGHVINPRRGEGRLAHLLIGDILLTSPKAIQAVLDGALREVSVGYDADYEDAGNGRGAQKNIVANHLAIVDNGRCGAVCRIGDRATVPHDCGRDACTCDAEFEENKHPRAENGQFGSGGGGNSKESNPIDPSIRDIKTTFPIVQGFELRKIYNVANREADKRGELSKPATAYPIEKVPLDKIIATQPGLNSNIVSKYEKDTSGKPATALFYKGKFYLQDGHHRAEAAKQRGETHVDAHVQSVGKRKVDDVAFAHHHRHRPHIHVHI